jgi:DNA-binding PadR family transcriptional regulator
MKNLWKFSLEPGKERGFLTLIILHSLAREPKSGYSLLKDIGAMTNGSWVPNKGTLYPILKSLAAESQIQITDTGKRHKIVYSLTDTGQETIAGFRGMKGESEERVAFFKNMHLEIFGEENITIINLLMDVRFFVERLPVEKKDRAMEIIRTAFAEIQHL